MITKKTVASFLLLASAALAPAAFGSVALDCNPSKNTTCEANYDRPGGDYVQYTTTAAGCQQACLNDGNCQAFTWVPAGAVSPQQRCFLKSSVPNPVYHPGFVSGVTAVAIPGN